MLNKLVLLRDVQNMIGAKQLLKERMANCHLVGNPEDGTDLLNQRLEAKIQSMMWWNQKDKMKRILIIYFSHKLKNICYDWNTSLASNSEFPCFLETPKSIDSDAFVRNNLQLCQIEPQVEAWHNQKMKNLWKVLKSPQVILSIQLHQVSRLLHRRVFSLKKT